MDCEVEFGNKDRARQCPSEEVVEEAGLATLIQSQVRTALFREESSQLLALSLVSFSSFFS